MELFCFNELTKSTLTVSCICVCMYSALKKKTNWENLPRGHSFYLESTRGTQVLSLASREEGKAPGSRSGGAEVGGSCLVLRRPGSSPGSPRGLPLHLRRAVQMPCQCFRWPLFANSPVLWPLSHLILRTFYLAYWFFLFPLSLLERTLQICFSPLLLMASS